MEEVMELEITALGNDVGGISPSKSRKTFFVRGALPGERVLCRPVKESGSFVRAELLDIISPSSHRTEPFCRYHGECGGCSIQHLEYGRQLFWKRSWVMRALSRMGLDPDGNLVEATIPSPSERGYRNRVSFDMTAEGPGLHGYRGDTIAVGDCPLLNNGGRAVYSSLNGRSVGGCRRISVRASDRTGRRMIEYVGVPEDLPQSQGSGTVLAWQDGGEWEKLPSDVFLTETMNDLTYRISPGCFFQVNTECAELLVDAVTGILSGAGSILDLYGGCGTFSLPLAKLGSSVTSVELNASASDDGRIAARENGITGIRFHTGRVRHFLLDSVSRGKLWGAVIVDPPRAGLGVRVSRLLRRVNSESIVYVSCNPFSMARDLSIICEKHWRIAAVGPVDMFPQTDHVETVVHLRRSGSK